MLEAVVDCCTLKEYYCTSCCKSFIAFGHSATAGNYCQDPLNCFHLSHRHIDIQVDAAYRRTNSGQWEFMNRRTGCESGGQERETQSERQVERQWFSIEERKSVFILGASPQAVGLRAERDSV